MASWPSTLQPKLSVSNYAEQWPDVVERTEMETGRKKTRRRFSYGPSKVQGSIWCTPEQLATFRNFFDVDLAMGALPIDWYHPTMPGDVPVQMMFVEPPQIAPILGGVKYQVTMNLEIVA